MNILCFIVFFSSAESVIIFILPHIQLLKLCPHGSKLQHLELLLRYKKKRRKHFLKANNFTG